MVAKYNREKAVRERNEQRQRIVKGWQALNSDQQDYATQCLRSWGSCPDYFVVRPGDRLRAIRKALQNRP